MTTSVLLVEDDPLQAELTARILQHEGYAVRIAPTGALALSAAQSVPPPVVALVDVGLTDLSGTEVVRRLRGHSEMGIILLTAKRNLADKVVGLDAGADDFISKPFEPEELLARLRALLRRRQSRAPTAQPSILTIGGLRIDTSAHRVTVDDHAVELTPREFAILSVLGSAGGNVVGRSELLSRVWGPDFFGDPGALDVYMRRLRLKLEHGSRNRRYLHTIRGAGFRLVDLEDSPI